MKNTFKSITKDLGAGLSRIVKNPDLLNELSLEEKRELIIKTDAYQPKVDKFVKIRAAALSILGESTDTQIEQELPSEVSTSIAEKIAKQTFIFEFHVSQPTFTKKVNSTLFLETFGNEGKINSERVRISKYLIDRKNLKPLEIHKTGFIKFIKGLSMPGGLLTPGRGQYLVPLKYLEELKASLGEFQTSRQTILAEFIANYQSYIDESAKALGAEFRPSEYPTIGEIEEMFSTSYKFISNAIPEEFEKVSKEIYEVEKQRIMSECASTAVLIQTSLRENFADLVAHFAERLSPDEETGKPKVFQKSTVDTLKQFVDTFASFNLTGDTDLESLISQTSQLLDGVDPGKIRTDEEFRANLTASFEDLKSKSEMLIVKRARKIDLD